MPAAFDPDKYLATPPKFDPDAYLASELKAEPVIASEPKARTGTALTAGAIQGATFGFADELAAGAKAALDTAIDAVSSKKEQDKPGFKQRYNDQLSKMRDYLKKLEEENPKAFVGGELAGGLLMPGGLVAKAARSVVGGVKGAKAAATVAKTAAQGAGMGGLTAAGYSEAKDAGELAQDVAEGAGTGAVLGGAIGTAGKFARFLGKQTGKAIDNMAIKEMGFNKPDLAKLTPEKQQKILEFAQDNKIIGKSAEETMQNAKSLREEAGSRLNNFIKKAAEAGEGEAKYLNTEKLANDIQDIMGKYDFEATRPVHTKLNQILIDIQKTPANDLTKVTDLKHAIGSLTTEGGEIGKVARNVYGRLSEDIKDNLDNLSIKLGPDVRSVYQELNNNYHLSNLVADAAVKKANKAALDSDTGGVLSKIGTAAVMGTVTGHPGLSAKIAGINIGMDLLKKRYGTNAAMQAKRILDGGGEESVRLSNLLEQKDYAGVASFLKSKSETKDTNEARKSETRNLLKQLKMPE